MKNTPQQMADLIFKEYHNWVKIINYSLESKKMMEAIALDMAVFAVNTTLESHSTKDEIIYWSKVKNLLKSKLINGKT
jgi:phosphoribosyl-AMP cyclohydrolase